MKLFATAAIIASSLALAENEFEHERPETPCERSLRLHPENSMDYQYLRYVAAYGKDYRTMDEYEHRRENFVATEHLLCELSQHLETQTVGHNMFSDWTHEEKDAIMALRASPTDVEHMRHRYAAFESDYVEDSVDWVERGAVTRVRNGGHCGSSWAHATVAAIEGAHYINGGNLHELSVQQLIDCDFYNYGCAGGFMASAFEYVEQNPLMLEKDYPEARRTDRACHYVQEESVVEVTRYINVVPNNVDQLKIAVSMAPVAVSISARHPLFLFYRRGVISSEDCGTDLDSAVTIVGYGEDHDFGQYWLVKNSWGTTWGEHGFARIAIRGELGVCGINQQPSIPFTN